MRRNLIAAIDVGSHAIRMKIGEINRFGQFKELESFRKIAVLGHDTFTTEKVSFESVDKICEILSNFKKTMDDYSIKTYYAVATSAIREALNRDYILDQVKLKTGFKVEVIDNAQEQFLTLKAVKYHMDSFEQVIKEGALVVVIGAGSIQVTTYVDGELLSSQNVKMGALRIKEILGSLENQTLKYNKILEEYIKVNLEGLLVGTSGHLINHLIVIGGEMRIISQMIEKDGSGDGYIKKRQLREMYRNILDKDPEEIRHEYGVKKERAEIILPSLMLLNQFVKMTESKEVLTPNISLVDGVVRSIYEKMYNLQLDEESIKDIITNARVLASAFRYNEEHCEYVEHIALMLFDKLKRVHGLKLERVHLHVASILHDIGKFISLDHHSLHSYDLIRSLELHGMSSTDMEMVALIARYHGMTAPKDSQKDYGTLQKKEKLIVAKLISILRMADALDRSHQQKISLTSIKVKDKTLYIKGTSKVDTTIEEWNFNMKAKFFQEVYGISPVIKITKEI